MAREKFLRVNPADKEAFRQAEDHFGVDGMAAAARLACLEVVENGRSEVVL